MKIIKKFNSLSAPAKASLIFVIANIFQKGLNFIMSPINTRIMNQADYGIVSVYDSWYAMISVVAMLSLYEAAYGVGLTDFKEDRDRFTFSLLVLSNIATLLCSIIYIANPEWVTRTLGLSNKLLVLMIIALLFYPALYFWTIRQRFEYKYQISATITILSSLLMSVFSVIAVLISENNKAEAKIITNFAVIFPVLIVLYISCAVKSKFKVKVSYWWYALKFTLPLIPHYLSIYLLDSSDRIMISKLVSKDATGVYDIACKFNSILIVIWSAINGSLIPWTYECLEKKKYTELKKVSTIIVVVAGVLSTSLSLVIPEVIKLFYEEEYYGAMYAVPPLTVGLFFAAIYYMFSNVEFYHKSTVFAMFSSIIAAIVNIVLNYLLIPKFGFVVAAYTTLIGYLVQTVLHYFNMRRVEKENVYDISFIIKFSLIIVAVNLGLVYLYEYPLVRYGIVAVIVAVIIRKKNMLIDIFKTIKNK